MENLNTDLILIGLPSSGKSTFIGALWHIVESGEVDSSLSITALPQDTNYLNGLRNSWLECKLVERNKAGIEKHVSLNIQNTVSKRNYNLVFPDVSGEMYELQFESRRLTTTYIESVKNATGVLLFINPNHLKKPDLIVEAQKMMVDASGALQESGNIATDGTKSWDIKNDTPTQVVLVDLLQIVQRFITRKIKLSIVISAWDVIENTPDELIKKIEPKDWIKSELPLLHQFLATNESIFDVQVFGVSAQGSEYGLNDAVLQNKDKQGDRVIVKTDSGTRSNDITLPIKSLLDE